MTSEIMSGGPCRRQRALSRPDLRHGPRALNPALSWPRRDRPFGYGTPGIARPWHAMHTEGFFASALDALKPGPWGLNRYPPPTAE